MDFIHLVCMYIHTAAAGGLPNNIAPAVEPGGAHFAASFVPMLLSYIIPVTLTPNRACNSLCSNHSWFSTAPPLPGVSAFSGSGIDTDAAKMADAIAGALHFIGRCHEAKAQ